MPGPERALNMTRSEAPTAGVVIALASRLMEAITAPDAAGRILAALRDALGGEAAALWLVEGNDGMVRRAEITDGAPLPGVRDDPASAIATLRAGTVLILPESGPSAPADRAAPLISFPVVIAGEPYGVVQVHGSAPRYGEPDAWPLLVEIAALLGLTFERARQRQELVTMRTTMLRLTTSLDLTQTLEAVLDGIMSLIPCTIATIYLDEVVPDALVRVAQRARDGTGLRLATQPRPLGGSITGWVYRHRQSLLVPDLGADTRVVRGEEAPPPGLCSIVVPLLAGERAVGTFIASRHGPNTLTQRDLAVAERFAPLAAQAVANARLYDEVRHARAQTETMMENISDAIIRADPTGVTIGWNKGAERLYGYTAAEMLGQRLMAVPPEEQPALMAMVGRVLQGESVINAEAVRVHKDGRRLNVLTSISPWYERGRITGTLAVVKDITERKALERELTEQVRAGARREWDTAYIAAVAQACNSAAGGGEILQALADLTAQWVDDARVVMFDGDCLTLAAYASRTPEEDADIRDALYATYTDGAAMPRMIAAVHSLHTPLIEDVSTAPPTPLRTATVARGYHTKAFLPIRAAGEVVGVLGVGARGATPPFDTQAIATLELVAEQAGLAITKDRLLRQVEAQVAQLEDANRHKDDFLASLSHELRTPLNAILGFGELIEDGVIAEGDELRDVAGDIVISGRLLLDQVNGLLDMARAASGQMRIAQERVEVTAVVAQCERVIAPLVTAKAQRLHIALPPDLPALRADTARLQQVLLNLLTNAHKFTPQGGTITLSASATEATVAITVRDTGIGIAPEHAAVIFEPFRRVETGYARAQSGTGLGLALSRRLTELMGGTLTVESAPGTGSIFTVTLPLAGGG
jgi:PAS domain S-box-containing protein